jgi:hypothetical protein
VRTLLALSVMLALPALASGPTTPILRIDHQALSGGGTTYAIAYGEKLASSADLRINARSRGPKNGTSVWDFAHVGDGSGWNGRNYMRWSRWAGVNGDPQAGFIFNPPRIAPTVLATAAAQPLYVRFRIRVVQPLVESGRNSSAQCKFFIFGGPGLANGNSRMIVFLERATDSTYGAGRSDAKQVTLRAGAGVSGSFAAVPIAVGEWTHVQVAWRYSEAGSPFQKVYRNTNVERSPTAQNTDFSSAGGSWNVPAPGPGAKTGWDAGHWAEIVSSNSYTDNDAIVDVMDFELDDEFDDSWYPGVKAG